MSVKGVTLQELVQRVREMTRAKVDYLANSPQIQMVEANGFDDSNVALVVLRDGAPQLERFHVSENAQRQIASWLEIPWTYYSRLLKDHRDLVIHQVNELFVREPGKRMIRTIGDTVRAFLSDRYRRLDNDQVLATTLPMILAKEGSAPLHEVLSSNVSMDRMSIKCVFTDPSLEQFIGTTRDGKNDTVNPGFVISNSETGNGSLSVRGFFYRGYCRNGAIWTIGDSEFTFTRTHLGGKLAADLNGVVFSDETLRKDDAAIVSAFGDVISSLRKPEFVTTLGDKLRALNNSQRITHPSAAVQVLIREVGLADQHYDNVLENLLSEGNLTQWGALNAITAVAHNIEDYDKATDIEAKAATVATFSKTQWEKIARAEKVLAKAA